jgi:hypothetical protein
MTRICEAPDLIRSQLSIYIGNLLQIHRQPRLKICEFQSELSVILGVVIPAANWYMNGSGFSEDMTAVVSG